MKKYISKFFSLFLCLLVLFNTCSVSFINVYGDTSSVSKNFINFYQNKDEMTLEAKELTNQDYYTLLVYMSNWFKPGTTTLNDLVNAEESGDNFLTAFAASLGMSGNTSLANIVKAFGADTYTAINTNNLCTLVNYDGTPLTGVDFLYTIIKTLNDEAYSVSILDSRHIPGSDYGDLRSSKETKVYYQNTSKEAFDMATPQTRAMLQTVMAYNPNMFLMKDGIASCEFMFIDAVGNVWGMKSGVAPKAEKDKLSGNTYLDADALKKLYLIIPACLNPATFTPNASDITELRMPLMNRFVLSALLNVNDFDKGVGGNLKFAEDFIPIYNLLSYGGGNITKSSLSVFGINSISPYLLNTNKIYDSSYWNDTKRKKDYANFLYNPDSFTVNAKAGVKGISEYSTNSYIVFSPNLSVMEVLNSGDGSGVKDLRTSPWYAPWNDKYSFTVMVGTHDNDSNRHWNTDEDTALWQQKKFLMYMFSPTVLELNQVSMNFYKYDTSLAKNEENLSNVFKDFLVSSESSAGIVSVTDSTMTNSKLTEIGLNGMSLFLEDAQIKYRNEDGIEKVCVTPENMVNSKLVSLLKVSNNYQVEAGNYDEPLYEKVKNGSLPDENNISFRDLLFLGANENGFSDYSVKSYFDRDYSYLGAVFQGATVDRNGKKAFKQDDFSVGLGFDSYNQFVIAPKLSSMVNAGSGNNDETIGRLIGLNETKIRMAIASRTNSISDLDFEAKTHLALDPNFSVVAEYWTTDKNGYNVLTKTGSKVLLDYISSIYGYSVFFPVGSLTSTVLKDSTTETSKLKVMGSEEISTKGGTTKSCNDETSLILKTFNDNLSMGIYLGYMVDMMGLGTCDEKSPLSFGSFSSKFLPKYSITSSGANLTFENMIDGLSGVSVSEDMSFENMQKDLIRRIYGLTNDSDNSYRNNLIKNIIEGFILTVHRTITGTWSSSISSVSTGNDSTYQSVTGYIYTPTLEELSFTATLMNNYIKIYILCFMFILFILILMVLLHTRTWQQGVITAVIMSVALLFPYVLISNTINVSNKISDSIYSDRFDFWAMSEHFRSVVSLQGSEYMDEKEKWLTVGSATTDTTKFGGSGVKIKWMAPKKVDMFQELYSDASLSQSFVTNMEIFKWLFANTIYDTEYVDTDVYGSYVYRRYNNIALEAQSYYEWGKILEKHTDGLLNSSTINYKGIGGTSNSLYVPKGLVNLYDKENINSKLTAKSDLFIAGFDRFIFDLNNNKSFYTDGMSGVQYTDSKYEDIEKVSQYKGTAGDIVANQADMIGTWGMMSEDVNNALNDIDFITNKVNPAIASNLPQEALANDIFKKDETNTAHQISKAIYLKNTESPYYYFYSVLKKRYGTATGISNNTDFKRSLIEYNTFKVDETVLLNSGKNVRGTYRDFLDMEGLFTFVIPYLKLGNDYVSEWQSVNGSEIEEYNFDYTVLEKDSEDGSKKAGDVDLDNLRELQDDGSLSNKGSVSQDYKEAVERKNAMNRVWNMYSPWVASLYDLDVLNEKVYLKTGSLTIEDSLNPSSYLNAKNRKGNIVGRPMIFSEADMIVKGYSAGDLTETERRIQAVTEQTYKDLMYLVNYYDMDDEVLISAAAMYATFNFNKEFSENKFLGSSVMLYPQGFELRNFNYDAFMRLALLNSTGENVFAESDLYQRVLSKTSLFTGLLLIICDLVACIIIPMFKFLVLIGLLFLGILICIACVVNPPDKIFEAVNKSLLLPTVLFMALNIGFSFAMSLVVGEGLTSYVGSKTVVLATNDPSITMLVMALMGIVYVFFAWKIMKLLIEAYKKFGMSSALATVGIIGSAISAGTKGIANKAAKLTGRTVRGVGRGASAVGGAVVGAAGAEKGKRLAGAFEGGSNGLKGAIKQRIRDNKRQEQMTEQNKDLADRLNAMSKSTSDGSGGGKGESSADKTPETKSNTTTPKVEEMTPEQKEETRRKAEEAMAEAQRRKELDEWEKDRHYEKLEKDKEKWDKKQADKQSAQENAATGRKKREVRQKAHNDKKSKQGNKKKKHGKKK